MYNYLVRIASSPLNLMFTAAHVIRMRYNMAKLRTNTNRSLCLIH